MRAGAGDLGQGWLYGARIVEGITARLCSPIEKTRKGQPSSALLKLARAATDLGDKRRPRLLRDVGPAAEALAREVRLAQENGSDIATNLEIARTLHANLGTKQLLPHEGTAEERIALFDDAIRRLRQNSAGGKTLDHEEVVSKCACACGNHRELFGALRKAVKR